MMVSIALLFDVVDVEFNITVSVNGLKAGFSGVLLPHPNQSETRQNPSESVQLDYL